MPQLWKLVSYKASELEVQKVSELYKEKNFPPGVLDNVPRGFLARAKWSSQYPDCIVFTYRNGVEPNLDARAEFDSYPTYKGLQPKKVSFMGKAGEPLEAYTVIKAACGHRLCINQQHLYSDGQITPKSKINSGTSETDSDSISDDSE